VPLWSEPSLVSPADLAACRALLRDGSRSFHAASRLLPRRVRDDAVALYAFCRVADDVIDQDAGRGRGGAALASLHERLALAYAGTPAPMPADRALADLVARRHIPMALPAALLEGFAWDAAERRYEDLSALIAYAVRVAGSVGAMMALLMGVRAPQTVARACDLGVAMQFTNIARDVGQDASSGRLYLPLSWLREAGIDPDAWLAHPVFNAALGTVVRRLLGEAEALYRRAEPGIARLPLPCRPAISAARLLYAEIGNAVQRRGFDSISGRAVVPATRKMQLLARGLCDVPMATRFESAPPLPETAFLVEAVADAMARSRSHQPGPVVRSNSRLAWVIDLFARLERRDQLERATP
jgi:phytoene synthase